jgi:hypothetical protein
MPALPGSFWYAVPARPQFLSSVKLHSPKLYCLISIIGAFGLRPVDRG